MCPEPLKEQFCTLSESLKAPGSLKVLGSLKVPYNSPAVHTLRVFEFFSVMNEVVRINSGWPSLN